MILPLHRGEDGVSGPVPFSASAVAAHRGDVTTVMAAAAVRLRAEQRAEKDRDHAPPPRMIDLVRASAAH